MADTQYKQCRLRRPTKDGTEETVAFLPEKFAVKGKWLKIGDINGWQVVSASGRKLSATTVNANSQDYKKTRRASDV